MDVENKPSYQGMGGGATWEIGTDPYTRIYKTENQQQPALWHVEL